MDKDIQKIIDNFFKKEIRKEIRLQKKGKKWNYLRKYHK